MNFEGTQTFSPLQWVKDLNSNFTKDVLMENKHIKRYSTSLVIRERQMKTTMTRTTVHPLNGKQWWWFQGYTSISKFIKLYTSNIYSSLYANCTSIDLFKKKKKESQDQVLVRTVGRARIPTLIQDFSASALMTF